MNPDKVVDLEKKLPFKDNSVDEILANHVLEHISNFVPLMHEFWRVCKKGAVIKIRTPFYSAWGQFNDPTHVRFFTPFTFNYFRKGNYSHEVGCKTDMFNIRKVKINFAIGRAKGLNWVMNPLINLHHAFYCRFFSWILPASEMEYELVVLKNR
ncbi:methyltransferase domain-containing protein [archaeon]|nr:methyltransferase domain-containing protein [archaeon]MBT3578278.1 methyltransferase domain-containing protein [archaeon]MBT6819801.1 methyltransferase domain-containing protein [archaeon]MBT6956162.1 methyltransferase domain-containing protein [archaeon]MBT7025583.1 methyltransferase domain-containing protein [archaeon]